MTNPSDTFSLPAALANQLCLLDSITDASEADVGKVALSGSHGGLYPAAVASQARVRAVVFNDAGIGMDGAGVKGVEALAGVGMAAASVDCFSARIGSTDDMLASGIISFVNTCAAKAGVSIGMNVIDALLALTDAAPPTELLPAVPEARWELSGVSQGEKVLCVDSASLVEPVDGDRIIVTGSHGGLIRGDPARALKAAAKLAVFNDAGVGKDEIGLSRLPALEVVGVAAVTVSHNSALIGSAQSSVDTGVVSYTNELAAHAGFSVGESLMNALADCADSLR